jgi:hypothetical protein
MLYYFIKFHYFSCRCIIFIIIIATMNYSTSIFTPHSRTPFTLYLQLYRSALKEALEDDLLSAECLATLNPYQPNLSTCWMFQRAMSCKVGTDPKPGVVVDTLRNSFSAMERIGPETLRPFLQDVLQFVPLLRTLSLAFMQDLLTPVKMIPHVGPFAILDFSYHFIAMAVYTVLASTLGPLLVNISGSLPSPEAKFRVRRLAEAWKFGSGIDYEDH